jgi:hypothetical protein
MCIRDRAKELGLEAKTLPPFNLAEAPMDNPEVLTALQAAVQLPEGAISPLIPSERGGLLACVTKREQPSEETRKARLAEYRMRLETSRQAAAFAEWLRLQRDELGAKYLAADERAEPSPPTPQPG